MKTLFNIVGPSFIILMMACQQPITPVKEKPVQIDTMQLIALPAQAAEKIASNEVSVVSRDSTTYVRFGDCYFSLDWITPDQRRNDFERHPDTIFLSLAPKHSIEGQMLAITTGEAEKMKVWQRYETSIRIGQQLIKNWKHFQSNWEQLRPEASNFFICRKYTSAQTALFPDASIEDLQQHVKKHYGKELYHAVTNLETIPRAVISTYYLKFNGTLRNSPTKINKLLIIDVTP
ncbi:hypothetical protein [Chitinophaga flava]|uniref:Uncharacterized protein n=1 Tax=Chitinophaga flava TaxID=2259036 RepID=A0A365Y6E3_9BACT|nr:hypothetical protein [Chitinophaga flava]RBL93574.1 hypothetical protein DF182_13770 [Chitinophaga flava]